MATSVTKIGVSDNPIEHKEQDTLGFDSKAEVLANFIAECETPMTIGIQGGWGTGKTSLMQLINKKLDEKKLSEKTMLADKLVDWCIPVWLNTWQYAQTYDENKLPLWIIAGLTRKLLQSLDFVDKAVFEANLNRLLKFGLGLLRDYVQRDHQINKEHTLTEQGKLADMDESSVVENIRSSFNRLITIATAANEDRRVVFFIDDIDRVRPEVAVRILEAIKNFLDAKGCVFVLAVDFEVVREGLAERGAKGGRDFFEKIVQVPYSLRPHTYKHDSYVISLLMAMDGVSQENLEGHTDSLRRMVELTTGLNPRTIKRALNLYAISSRIAEISRQDLPLEHRLLTMSLSCIQVSHTFSPAFDYLTRSTRPEITLLALAHAAELDDDIEATVAKYLGRTPDNCSASIELIRPLVDNLCESAESAKDSKAIKQLSELFSTIRDWLAGKDKIISSDEIARFRAVLESSSTTSYGPLSDQNDTDSGSTGYRQISLRDLKNAELLSEDAKFIFADTDGTGFGRWCAFPDWTRGPRHYAIKGWGGKRPASGTSQTLQTLTRNCLDLLRRGSKSPQPPKFWVIDDPAKGHVAKDADCTRLVDILEEYRSIQRFPDTEV